MRWLTLVAAVAIVALGGFIAIAWKSAIPPVAAASAGHFDDALVKQGAQLAAIGNCSVCHSTPGGKLLAGGLAIPTPFGTIYSSNITPDRDTGIGAWDETAFIRAMREGVDREGRHLYPAFPYDHFTTVTDADNRALYAFLMTREPVRQTPPQNELPFPLNIRLVLAGWKLLFFRPGVFQSDPGHDETWNRGAYLAEGLGHCGACHTPRNLLGAEKKGEKFAGGVAEGWTAYAIDASSPSPIPWTTETLTSYLKQGWEQHHGISRGPMGPVTANLGSVAPSDVTAIATYVASIMGEASPERRKRAETILSKRNTAEPGIRPAAAGSQISAGTRASAVSQTAGGRQASGDTGAAIYAAACSGCHDAGRPLPYGGLNLFYSTAVNGPDATNPVHVILYGLPAPEGAPGAMMPGFAGVLNDTQMAALLGYMRSTFSDQPAWTGLESLAAKIRKGDEHTRNMATDDASSAPANPTKRDTSW